MAARKRGAGFALDGGLAVRSTTRISPTYLLVAALQAANAAAAYNAGTRSRRGGAGMSVTPLKTMDSDAASSSAVDDAAA